MQIEEVLHNHTSQLMAIPGVTGVGIGEKAGKPVLLIMVKALTQELKKQLPSQLAGIPIQVEVVGEISAF
jgi:hypothetical protein